MLADPEAAELLAVSLTTYLNWKIDTRRARLGKASFLRMSHVFWIYKSLKSLYPDDAQSGGGWLRRINTNVRFGGKPPLSTMLSDDVQGLMSTRRYIQEWLDA